MEIAVDEKVAPINNNANENKMSLQKLAPVNNLSPYYSLNFFFQLNI